MSVIEPVTIRTMSTSGPDWSESTEIEVDEIGDYVFKGKHQSSPKLVVDSYSVKPNMNGLAIDHFVSYLREKFPWFVFSDEVIEERGPVTYIQAQERVNPRSFEDGFIGEYLLYLFCESFLDMPVVIRKVGLKQSSGHPVYGSDGVYVGEIDGNKVLAPGEAKTMKSLTSAISDALDSLEDFSGPGSAHSIDMELPVAGPLNKDLEEEQVEEVMDLIGGPLPQEYSIVHPVMICYEQDELSGIASSTRDTREMVATISEIMEQENYLESITDDSNYANYREVLLVFMFLPVPELSEFRENTYGAIFRGDLD